MNTLIVLIVLACVIGSLAQNSNDKGSKCESNNNLNICALNN